ncbi:MAG: hypothetical protein QMD85_00460, partial [Candidatus Aenigmarchaeota archaeon]|nr:hypothetical protein [Candidatus Aenigmarchaeota archaeon]MDI6721991.1 hypothetical protein [Candidatus Aenigmarchaeota archaeon]
LKTFEMNKRKLLRESRGKYVLIKNSDIIGTFEEFSEAANRGIAEFGNASFLVKKVEEKEQKMSISLLSLK